MQKPNEKNNIELAYLKNFTEKHLGWKRLYVQDESKADVYRPPLQPGVNVAMALVVPNTVEIANGDRVKLATQTRAAGRLVEDLMSPDGKEFFGTIATVDVPANPTYNSTLWDGTNPKTGAKQPGRYLIRWTLNNEVRTWPVVVKMGEARRRKTTTALKPGETLHVNFAQSLDPARCILEGATISEEQSHGGKESLKLENGEQARILLGDQDNLPVRISMWVYDGGESYGRASINGGAWGVQTSVGDNFVIRQCWRRYLNGDTGYSWFNTSENQYFTPHPVRAPRRKGWSQWVLDFTNPQKPSLSCNGAELGPLEPAKYVPSTGATSLFFLGGDSKAGPIYIDDITVEYPKQ